MWGGPDSSWGDVVVGRPKHWTRRGDVALGGAEMGGGARWDDEGTDLT